MKLNPKPRILIETVQDTLPYGKYKGKTVQHVIETDLQYAKWMQFNMVAVKFHSDIRDAIRSFEFLAR